MERQLERRKEPEPITFIRSSEERWLRREKEKQKADTLPKVLKYDEIPWAQNAQTYLKRFCGPGLAELFKQLPIYTFNLAEQMIAPKGHPGKHRHFQEAIFYIVDGEGYEIHDGVKYPWEAGDVMTVPTYCIHQHFNATDKPARLFFSVHLIFEYLGIWFTEQMEIHANYRFPEGSQTLYGPKGEVVGYKTADGVELRFGAVDGEFEKLMDARGNTQFKGEPRSIYERYVKLLPEQMAWRRAVPHVVKNKDVPWENTPMGRLKYLVHPFGPSPVNFYDCFVQEIPPGGRSGQHRHMSEEAHKILDGKGYDIIDGKRWDWGKEDVVAIPVNAVHQHFNADPQRPARFVAFQSRIYHYAGHGGFQHIENTPEWKE